MYQALYRKYRPTSFRDVCGQEHITSVLKMQLQKGRVSHAYMFCGSRGTGKTSCAKILAKAVNCENPVDGEPCNECASCKAINEERVLDVVEMDAASNNGVDHIRRLCDEVQFLPSQVKKRVYIIDEVHMLSTSAFNALLKTIEEPPSHVLFILATTEMNDVPATIMSRCQRFDFKRLTPQVIAGRLMEIAEKEGIPLRREAADVIAGLSDGAMRDALSLLEACQGQSGEITGDRIHSILGLGGRESILALCRAIATQDVAACLELVDQIYEKMSDFKEIIGQLIALYRDLLVIRSVKDYEKYVEGYDRELPELLEIAKLLSVETILYQAKELENFYVTYDRIATGKKASAEILLIRLCNEKLSQEPAALLSRISKLENGVPIRQTSASAPPAKTAVRKEAEPQTAKPSAPVPDGGVFEGSLKLKNLLQSVPYIKPWIGQLQFSRKGDVVKVLSGPFVKGLLISSDARDVILQCAQKVDDTVRDVIFEETTRDAAAESDGLEGL